MGCFFSGTDQQELHDNAPNHNYYLSLIVNFNSYKEWCAKIAYIGEESQKGVVTSWFKGTLGNMIERIVNVDKTVKTLYTINLDIVCEENAVEEVFANRITELSKPKQTFSHAWKNEYGNAWKNGYISKNTERSGVGVQRTMWEEFEEMNSSLKKVPKDVIKIDISRANLEKFVKSLVSTNSEIDKDVPLYVFLQELEKGLYPEYPNDVIDAERDIFLEAIGENLETHFMTFFNNVRPDAKSLEIVATAIENKLLNIKKYKDFSILYDIVNMFYVV